MIVLTTPGDSDRWVGHIEQHAVLLTTPWDSNDRWRSLLAEWVKDHYPLLGIQTPSLSR